MIPFRIHGMIELVVGLVLALLRFVLGWGGVERTFYVAVGVVMLIVWAPSDYNTHGAGAAAYRRTGADQNSACSTLYTSLLTTRLPTNGKRHVSR